MGVANNIYKHISLNNSDATKFYIEGGNFDFYYSQPGLNDKIVNNLNIQRIETFRIAKDIQTKLNQYFDSKLGVLVGDLGLPRGIREDIVSSTHNLINDKNLSIVLAESKIRNQGKRRLLDKLVKQTSKFSYEECFYKYNYLLCKKTLTKGIVFFNPYCLDKSTNFPFCIGLLNDLGFPACATILLGRYYYLRKQGFDHVITVYHSSVDPYIFRKHLDGAILYYAFTGDHKYKISIITLYDEYNKSESIYHVDSKLITDNLNYVKFEHFWRECLIKNNTSNSSFKEFM